MSTDSMAVDGDGQPLAYSPAEVDAIVRRAIDEGELIAAIVRHNGDLMVQVLGPPSHELLEILEQATTAYRRVMKGHA